MARGQYDRTAARLARDTAEDSAQAPPSPRATGERRARRNRDDGDLDRTARMRLAIPQSIQETAKREGKTLRWVRNDTGRMHQMHSEDWDIVTGIDPVSASRTDEGQMVLMSKFADWYDKDREHLKATNDSLQKSATSPESQENVSLDGLYAPKGTVNKIQ
jgi:hypothetical protein